MRAAAWAPGRVNLIGEHTDYNGGLVLPMAIHLGTTASVESRGDSMLVMTSAQKPDDHVTIPVDDLGPGCLSGWASYVAGTVWALGLGESGWNIHVDGNVPLGSGLSSSASLEAAVSTALLSATGLGLPLREVARSCQRAENEVAGVPTGAMDQVACLMSTPGSALLFDTGADTVDSVPLDGMLAEASLLVLDTGVAHALASSEYRVRRRECLLAAERLGVPTLTHVADLEAAEAQIDDHALSARVQHVHTENQRVVAAVTAITQGDAVTLGRLMLESHASLRDDFEVSCAELDAVVESAAQSGALGARMTGGGFGGSVVALVPHDQIDRVVATTPARRVIAVAPGGGARPL